MPYPEVDLSVTNSVKVLGSAWNLPALREYHYENDPSHRVMPRSQARDGTRFKGLKTASSWLQSTALRKLD